MKRGEYSCGLVMLCKLMLLKHHASYVTWLVYFIQNNYPEHFSSRFLLKHYWCLHVVYPRLVFIVWYITSSNAIVYFGSARYDEHCGSWFFLLRMSMCSPWVSWSMWLCIDLKFKPINTAVFNTVVWYTSILAVYCGLYMLVSLCVKYSRTPALRLCTYVQYMHVSW